jgi:opacity protein-like surface antigen
MKKILFAIVIASFAASTAAAHEEIPEVEIFGGFSLLKIGVSNNDIQSFQDELYGGFGKWNNDNTSFFLKRGGIASFAFNLNEYFSIVADARYNQGDVIKGSFEFMSPETLVTVKSPAVFGTKTVSALAGPRVSFRTERTTAFFHTLAGMNYLRLNVDFTVAGVKYSTAANNFGPGVSVGGGFDVNVNEKIAVRVIQADYYPARQMEHLMNNVNLSFGIVFRVGEKVLR